MAGKQPVEKGIYTNDLIPFKGCPRRARVLRGTSVERYYTTQDTRQNLLTKYVVYTVVRKVYRNALKIILDIDESFGRITTVDAKGWKAVPGSWLASNERLARFYFIFLRLRKSRADAPVVPAPPRPSPKPDTNGIRNFQNGVRIDF
jgi:hypothetical protein